jgi:hypothetical protein
LALGWWGAEWPAREGTVNEVALLEMTMMMMVGRDPLRQTQVSAGAL